MSRAYLVKRFKVDNAVALLLQLLKKTEDPLASYIELITSLNLQPIVVVIFHHLNETTDAFYPLQQKFQSLPVIFGYRIFDDLINPKNKALYSLTLNVAGRSFSMAKVCEIYFPVRGHVT